MLRRLHPDQPESFAFTPANQAWAEAQITKFPEGRQASAVIPLLWRAQEQEGWLTRPAMEHVADMLGMAYIRVLEVATFYFMFQLQPVGSVAHFQICGTLSCMLCGSEDLMKTCRDKIADKPHQLSADGKFSWEEVECLGACANAPMAQVGKDYYEDLTTERLAEIIDEMAAGQVPTPGPQNGRYAAEPIDNLTSLTEGAENRDPHNAAVALAVKLGDTLKRIDGTEVPLTTPWQNQDDREAEGKVDPSEPRPAQDRPADASGVTEQQAPASSSAKPDSADVPADVPHDAVDGDDTPVGGKSAAPSGEEAPAGASDAKTDDRSGAADATAPGGAYNAPKTQTPGGTASTESDDEKASDKASKKD